MGVQLKTTWKFSLLVLQLSSEPEIIKMNSPKNEHFLGKTKPNFIWRAVGFVVQSTGPEDGGLGTPQPARAWWAVSVSPCRGAGWLPSLWFLECFGVFCLFSWENLSSYNTHRQCGLYLIKPELNKAMFQIPNGHGGASLIATESNWTASWIDSMLC